MDSDTAIMETRDPENLAEETPLLSNADRKISRQRFRNAILTVMKIPKPERHLMNWEKLEKEFNWTNLWINR